MSGGGTVAWCLAFGATTLLASAGANGAEPWIANTPPDAWEKPLASALARSVDLHASAPDLRVTSEGCQRADVVRCTYYVGTVPLFVGGRSDSGPADHFWSMRPRLSDGADARTQTFARDFQALTAVLARELFQTPAAGDEAAGAEGDGGSRQQVALLMNAVAKARDAHAASAEIEERQFLARDVAVSIGTRNGTFFMFWRLLP